MSDPTRDEHEALPEESQGFWARLKALLARARKTFGGYWGGI